MTGTPAPLPRPTAWRLLIAAFAVWAAQFIGGYAFALIFPGEPLVRWAIAALFIAGLPAFWQIDRLGRARMPAGLVRGAVVIALIASTFGALVALL